MSNIKDMMESRAALAKQMKDLTAGVEAEKRGFNAEEDQKWDSMTNEYSSLDKTIRSIQESRALGADIFEELEGVKAKDLSKEERHAQAVGKYIRGGVADLSAEERNLMAELRAQSTGTDAEGGFLTHSEFQARVDEALKAFGGMRDVAEIINTSNGSDLLFPTFDDTANEADITAENTDIGTDNLAFGQTTIGAHMYTSGVYLVPVQLLQDSLVDIEGMIAGAIGTRIARKQNKDFTVGTGTGQPSGIMTGVTGVETAAVGAIGYDDLVDLIHGVDSAYRSGAKFMLNDATLAQLRKLKDANGLPLWGMKDLTNGEPNTLLGHSYVINNDMAGIANGANPIVFGDLSKYKIRDVSNVSLQRFDEKYMNALQVGFMGYRRSGGGVVDAGTAFKALTIKSA